MLCCFVFLFVALSLASGDNATMYLEKYLPICWRGLPLKDRRLEMICCEIHIHTFSARWPNGGFYLSRYLELLATWRCPQFPSECKRRSYDFSEFTSLTYDRFCNHSRLEQRCSVTLDETLNKNLPLRHNRTLSATIAPSNDSVEAMNWSSSWTKMIGHLNGVQLDRKSFLKPCVQVSLMDTESARFGDYHEITESYIPFCSTIWSGFSRSVIENNEVATWDCMSQRCQANVVIIIVLLSILSLATVAANTLVIVVFATTPKLQNSQSVYKMSLAVADLLAGAVVFPAYAVSISKLTRTPAKMGRYHTFRNPNFSEYLDWDQAPMTGRDGFHQVLTTGFFAEKFETPYVYAIGCLTTVSLFVTIYTLMMAGFDRLIAINRPLLYRRYQAKKVALRVCISLWVIAIFYSVIPLFTSGLKYSLLASILIGCSGTYALIMYIIGFLIPLIVVWTTNILIYTFVRRQAKKRRHMASHSVNQHQEADAENRLTVTLTMIVGVFTLSALPVTLVAIVAVIPIPSIQQYNTDSYSDTAHAAFNSTEFLAVVILMCNSLWNWFIYNARNKDFKSATKDLYHKIRQIVTSTSLCSFRLSARNTRKSSTPSRRSTNGISNISSVHTNSSACMNDSPELEKRKNKICRAVTRGDSVFHSFHLNLHTDCFLSSVMKKLEKGTEEDDQTKNGESRVNVDEEIKGEVGKEREEGEKNELPMPRDQCAV